MGIAYKKNLKKLYGKGDTLGHESVLYGDAGLNAPVSATDMLTTFGADDFVVTQKSVLRFVHFQLASSAIISGEIVVSLLVNGQAVATGSLLPSTGRYLKFFFEQEKNEEIKLSAGDLVKAQYEILQSLGGSKILSAKVGITYCED